MRATSCQGISTVIWNFDIFLITYVFPNQYGINIYITAYPLIFQGLTGFRSNDLPYRCLSQSKKTTD